MHSLLILSVLLAQEAGDAAAPAADGASGNSIVQLFPMIAMLLLLAYFMLIRPEKRKQQAHRDMLSSLKKSDRVVTVGGIKGIVAEVQRDADEVTINVDDKGTKIRLTLSSIARVESRDEDESDKKS